MLCSYKVSYKDKILKQFNTQYMPHYENIDNIFDTM